MPAQKSTPRFYFYYVWAALLGLGALALPADARAQACCAATGAGEFAVVGRCQSAVLAAQITAERPHGTYNADHEYSDLRGAEVDDITLMLGGGIRPFHPSWQVYASAPARLQYRAFEGGEGEFDGGLGDIAAGLRWTAFEDSMTGISGDDAGSLIPFVDVFLDLKMPTGRPPEQSSSPLAADVTGDGAWQTTLGLKLTKFISASHVLGAQASYGYAFARDVDYPGAPSTEFNPGNSLDFSLSYLHLHNIFWSWGLTSSLKFKGPARVGGELINDSELRRLRAGAHITHGFSFPFWEATLSVLADAWWDGPNKNVPMVGPAITLGVRRQFL